jgi:hypothetical protein
MNKKQDIFKRIFKQIRDLSFTEQIKVWKTETGLTERSYFYNKNKYAEIFHPKCIQCTYEWDTRNWNPKVCPRCNSINWNSPLKIVRQNLGIRWCDNQKEYMRIYRQKNKERQIDYRKRNCKNFRKLHKSDELYRLSNNIRNHLRKALQRHGNGKVGSSRKYGIVYKEIFDVIGPRPSKDYHLDHIRPLVTFDLTDVEEVKKAYSPSNLRWIRSEENFKKSSFWCGEHWTRKKALEYRDVMFVLTDEPIDRTPKGYNDTHRTETEKEIDKELEECLSTLDD